MLQGKWPPLVWSAVAKNTNILHKLMYLIPHLSFVMDVYMMPQK